MSSTPAADRRDEGLARPVARPPGSAHTHSSKASGSSGSSLSYSLGGLGVHPTLPSNAALAYVSLTRPARRHRSRAVSRSVCMYTLMRDDVMEKTRLGVPLHPDLPIVLLTDMEAALDLGDVVKTYPRALHQASWPAGVVRALTLAVLAFGEGVPVGKSDLEALPPSVHWSIEPGGGGKAAGQWMERHGVVLMRDTPTCRSPLSDHSSDIIPISSPSALSSSNVTVLVEEFVPVGSPDLPPSSEKLGLPPLVHCMACFTKPPTSFTIRLPADSPLLEGVDPGHPSSDKAKALALDLWKEAKREDAKRKDAERSADCALPAVLVS